MDEDRSTTPERIEGEQEYSPREVKMAVVGNGGASKQQVQKMIQHLFKLQEPPEPIDASDALAVAICHLHRMESKV